MSEFLQRLKQRKIVQWSLAYVAAAFALLQGMDIVAQRFGWPEQTMRFVIIALTIGLFVTLLLAWYHGERGAQRVTGTELLILALLLMIGGGFLWHFAGAAREPVAKGAAEPAVPSLAIPAKSIAVLPFENLSAEKENAFFADGIQDEILTRLAKIGDLKVISRTSTQRYKSSPDDLPKIAQQLGVAHVLEGSVQKAGNQVRVTVQLIEATSDAHLWAETYDRRLTDIFAVESEIAERIARSLRARLTGAEQKAVAARPTENPEAYEAYLHGLALWNRIQTSPRDLDNTVHYFSRAVQLDENFALAWASLSAAHSYIYAEFERTPERLAQAKLALDVALRLAPEAGETQFALGLYQYRGLGDYESALAAFAKARDQSASRVEAYEFSAYVKRRQGKWDDAIEAHRHSLELDPRNPILLSESATTYRAMRRFDEARRLLDRGLEIEPASFTLKVQEAEICQAQGDIAGATRLLARVPSDGQDPVFLDARVRHWSFLHQYDEAIGALRRLLAQPDKLPSSFVPSYRAWLGIAQALAGKKAEAQRDLTRARDELTTLRAEGDKGPGAAANLILSAAFLGDEATVQRLALELKDEMRRDALGGPALETTLAQALARLGKKEEALASVRHLLQTYGENCLTPALLRLDPMWDALRSDPRFEKLAQP